MKKLKIKKGDTVYVNAGNDKGKTGKVLSVLKDEDRVIVEGINLVSKHTSRRPVSIFPTSIFSIPPAPLQSRFPPAWVTSSRTVRRSALPKNQDRRSSNYGKAE